MLFEIEDLELTISKMKQEGYLNQDRVTKLEDKISQLEFQLKKTELEYGPSSTKMYVFSITYHYFKANWDILRLDR